MPESTRWGRSEAIEIEVKLAVGSDFVLPDLDGVADGVASAALERRDLEATYYDTDDLRLARADVSLRYRTGEGDADGWTVKLPTSTTSGDGALVRRERVFDGGPAAPPAAARSLVAGVARGARLRPVARLHTVRQPVELRDADGRRLAEVVDDDVTVHRQRRVTQRFREVEVELVDGAPPLLLGAVLERLQQAGAGPPDSTPKVVRALGDAAVGPPDVIVPRTGKSSTAGAVVTAALAASVARLLRHDPGVRTGEDPEDVHQARVATRRLRSDLRTFRPLLERAWSAPLREELQWFAGVLGAVRDADVLSARVTAHVAALPSADAAAGEAIIERLGSARARARRALLSAMSSPRYVAMLERLVAAAAAPELVGASEAPARTSLPELVRRPWKHLAGAVAALGPSPVDASLHEVRIRAKRCRYAAEAVAPAVGKDARRLARSIARVQDVLGDHHDAAVCEGWLREVAGTQPGVALAAGELVAVQRIERVRLAAVFAETWSSTPWRKRTAWF